MQDLPSSLLLVTHVALRKGPHGLMIDDQTAAGIARWAEHFDTVTFYGIEEGSNVSSSSTTWVYLGDVAPIERCRLLSLPRAYRPHTMLRHYLDVRRQLSGAIQQHRYLCFTIGGILGDWPAIAAREARRQRRRYAAWIDRVEARVIENKLAGMALPRRIAARAMMPAMEMYTRNILRHSAVALLQGGDTFDHYSRWCPAPHCTYDTHTQTDDQIAPTRLRQKQLAALDNRPLKIAYVGRADPMKGPMDWLRTLEDLQGRGVSFEATWVGDGPELPAMRRSLAAGSMADCVSLAGFVGDRGALMETMRQSDVFLFCHKTLESPRSLIEALVCACPLVGYETAYSRGLVGTHGGGSFAPMHDTRTLAGLLEQLHRDRTKLADLVGSAALSGRLYNEQDVYSYRAKLMKAA